MIPKNNNLLKHARELRKNMTRHEKHLWYDFLKNYPVKIYKQRIIGNYIADFYCHSAKLVIELDGSQHFEKCAVEYDKERTEFLNSLGIEVLRFPNSDIDKHFYEVCELVDNCIQGRCSYSSQLNSFNIEVK